MVEQGNWIVGRGFLAHVVSVGKKVITLRQFGQSSSYRKEAEVITDGIKDKRFAVVSESDSRFRDAARQIQFARIPEIAAQMERLNLRSIRIDSRVIFAIEMDGSALCVGRGEEKI